MSVNFTLTGVEPKLGGNKVVKVPEGPYHCMIQSVDLDETPGREMFNVYVDIVEGEHTGAFDDEFAKKNPWCHVVPIRFTDFEGGQRDLDIIAGDFMRISDWNDGFDAAAAFDRRDWASFFGKRCCALRRYKKYANRDGEVKDGFEFYRLVSRDESTRDWALSPKPKIPDNLWGAPVDGPYSDWFDAHPGTPTPDGIQPNMGSDGSPAQAPVAVPPEPDDVPTSVYDDDFMV